MTSARGARGRVAQVLVRWIAPADAAWAESRRSPADEPGAHVHRLESAGQTTDQYINAVAHLGAEHVPVRLGGVYALERLMADSPADQRTIVEVLAAYVREQAPALGDTMAGREAHAGPRRACRQPSPCSAAVLPRLKSGP